MAGGASDAALAGGCAMPRGASATLFSHLALSLGVGEVSMNTIVQSVAAVFVLSLGAHFVRADDGRWVFSTGVDYSTGDYGEAHDTTIVTVPLSAGYAAERWRATLTVPLVDIEGPGTIVPGGIGGGGLLGGLLAGDAANPASPLGGVDSTGLGDVSLEVSAVPFVSEGGTQASVTGRVRAPTGDAERGLGTGEAAAAIAGGLRQPIGPRAAIFGTVGYEHAFDGGGSGVFAGAGAESYVAERVLAGATIDFAQASSELRRDAAQAGAYVGLDVADNTRIVAYGAAGLSETSPDVQAGLRIVFGVR